MRQMIAAGLVIVIVSMLFLAGCGDDAPTAPTPTPPRPVYSESGRGCVDATDNNTNREPATGILLINYLFANRCGVAVQLFYDIRAFDESRTREVGGLAGHIFLAPYEERWLCPDHDCKMLAPGGRFYAVWNEPAYPYVNWASCSAEDDAPPGDCTGVRAERAGP